MADRERLLELAERNHDIAERYANGDRMVEIATIYGISVQRVQKIAMSCGKTPNDRSMSIIAKRRAPNRAALRTPARNEHG